MATFRILIGAEAKVEFLAVPFPFRRQINQRVQTLKADPRVGDAEAIAGSDRFRLDVAGWRILYEVDDTLREVTIVAFRKLEQTK